MKPIFTAEFLRQLPPRWETTYWKMALRQTCQLCPSHDSTLLSGAVVHPGWLLGVRQALSQEGVLGMSGLVLAEKSETESQIRFEFDFGGFNGAIHARPCRGTFNAV
jgi:hypothetical protein